MLRHGIAAAAGVAVALASAGSARADDQPQTPRVVDRARELFPQTRGWFALVEGAVFDEAPDGRLTPRFSSLTHPRVRQRDNAGRTVTPRFPRAFRDPVRITGDREGGRALELAPVAARPAVLDLQDGVVVYAGAYADTDVLYKATPTHTDEYLLLWSRKAPTEWRYRVTRGPGIAKLRQAGNSVEAVDERGVAWLRANRPKAVDRAGRRAEGTIRVDGDELIVSIDTSELSLPILVDPDWKSTGDMAFGRFYFQSTLLPDGRVLATGGCSASICSGNLTLPACPSVVTGMEALDLDSRTWSIVGQSATPRFFHAAALLGDGRVLLAGGCWDKACTAATEIFAPATETLAPAAAMHAARGRAATVPLADGRVLVIGGCATIECDGVLADAEIYDPAADTWTATGAMATARAGHFAARLADGRVLVGGGCADGACSDVLRSTEIFDPATATFAAAELLVQPRVGATAVTLPDGVVLVSQGCSAAGCDLTNELYAPGAGFQLTDPAVTVRAFHELTLHGPRRQVVAIGGCQPSTCSWWNETWDAAEHFGDVPDAGPTGPSDASPPPPDARPGSGGTDDGGGSCGCRAGDAPAAPALALLVLGALARRRQR